MKRLCTYVAIVLFWAGIGAEWSHATAQFLNRSGASAPFLIDRDSESWGYKPGGVKLSEKLTTQMNKVQRFNPAVVAGKRALLNTKLYIDFSGPVELLFDDVRFVKTGARAWRRQDENTYMADLGTINPGTFINAFEAVHFRAVAVGTLRFAYLISAQDMLPKSGVILIEVAP